ncbi:glycosyl transferase family protein [Mesorhizobium loti]|nr:glycosyl transferase family protein [Mesorhizobium loti]
MPDGRLKASDTKAQRRPIEATHPASSYLGKLRLLVALDCLLVEGSVTRAAQRLALSPAAVSRLLGQARELYGDPLLKRSGRRLVPTPRAESLRKRLRALAAETERVMDRDMPGAGREEPDPAVLESWQREPMVQAPPLAMRPAFLLDDEPGPEALARQLAGIENDGDPRRRLAKYIAVVGRKSGNSRPLTLTESQDAFATILQGDADPMQVGALLRLISYRGETAAELAGLVRAARDSFHASGAAKTGADLDWPAYPSPRSLRTPWFVQSALLVADAGHRVVMHGSHAGGKLERAVEAIGIPVALSTAQARVALSQKNIVYMPLAGFGARLQGLMSLYPLFESRSSINSAVHLLNPLAARTMLLGVSQPAYRELHRDTALLLGHGDLSIVASSRDVAECNPFRAMTMHRLVEGRPVDLMTAAQSEPVSQGIGGLTSLEYWMAVWSGAARDARATEIIVLSAALALMTINKAANEELTSYRELAVELWERRHKRACSHQSR